MNAIRSGIAAGGGSGGNYVGNVGMGQGNPVLGNGENDIGNGGNYVDNGGNYIGNGGNYVGNGGNYNDTDAGGYYDDAENEAECLPCNGKNEEQSVETVCVSCLATHDEKYENNYPWLSALGHGKVIYAFFEEPVSSGKFKVYDSKWWKVHCDKVSHGNDLYQAHVEAFINPETRFARMFFRFEDNTLMEANEEFYRLEQEYYNKHGLCK